MIPVGVPVKIIDDVDKPKSKMLGKMGVIVGYKWNRYREEQNLPVVKLDDGTIFSGWSLWYEPQTYPDMLKKLSHQQVKELLVENFGETNAKYHTLDEISLQKLITKIEIQNPTISLEQTKEKQK
jgi:hypothetical protein